MRASIRPIGRECGTDRQSHRTGRCRDTAADGRGEGGDRRVDGLSAQVENLRQNTVDPAAGDRQIQEAEKEVQRLIGEKAKADEELAASETFAANEYGGIKGASGNSGRPASACAIGRRWSKSPKQKGASRKSRRIWGPLAPGWKLSASSRRRLATRSCSARTSNCRVSRKFEGRGASLETHKKQLAELIANRETAIRAAVERDPQHVRYDDGFLNQLKMLDQIAHEDTKIALVIVLIDVVSFRPGTGRGPLEGVRLRADDVLGVA